MSSEKDTVRPIRVLDAVTIGQIAAGEVIERPASVVKELVENAIDAGARRITVTAERGGIERIEVVDDGCGIDGEELARAVLRHATSKLGRPEDLGAIATLGFRGEGLASIAAVSEVEIVSRTSAADVGARIAAHGEGASAAEPAASPVGTCVRAAALFERLPARREFLRAPATEFARISAFLSTVSLAYPEIAFTLRHDGRDVWTMPATDDMRERLAMVFGREAAAQLVALAPADRTLAGSLRGYVSAPESVRADKRMQLLFVNRRLVKSAPLAGAWIGGYSTYVMLGRYPYGVLFVELDPSAVDVNVHPAKSEVRLRYSSQVVDAVRRTIAQTLAEHAGQRYREHAGDGAVLSAMPGDAAVVSLFESTTGAGERSAEAPFRVLGQLQRTYILATDGEALVLLDQHAAHERIAYESIVARAESRAPSEPLLVLTIVELDAARSEALEHALEILSEGGLEIEAFGENAYRIVATPAGYGARAFDLAGFIDDLGAPKERTVRERVWASLACHSVTRSGESLGASEMLSLVTRLARCRNPMHCPHGRPTMVRLDPSELAHLFKR